MINQNILFHNSLIPVTAEAESAPTAAPETQPETPAHKVPAGPTIVPPVAPIYAPASFRRLRQGDKTRCGLLHEFIDAHRYLLLQFCLKILCIVFPEPFLTRMHPLESQRGGSEKLMWRNNLMEPK
jgi:hypothetical protein